MNEIHMINSALPNNNCDTMIQSIIRNICLKDSDGLQCGDNPFFFAANEVPLCTWMSHLTTFYKLLYTYLTELF